jgi:Hsp70 protein
MHGWHRLTGWLVMAATASLPAAQLCTVAALSLVVFSMWHCCMCSASSCIRVRCDALTVAYRCVGVWQNDRVEIIANDQGNRTTPSYVGFTDSERLIGDAAKNQVAMNPVNTVRSC